MMMHATGNLQLAGMIYMQGLNLRRTTNLLLFLLYRFSDWRRLFRKTGNDDDYEKLDDDPANNSERSYVRFSQLVNIFKQYRYI